MNAPLKKAQEVNRRKRANGEEIVKKNPLEAAKENPKSLRKAINAKCWDCCCFQRAEVKKCSVPNCPLYRLRPWQGKDKT